jgi:hypothetical protein
VLVFASSDKGGTGRSVTSCNVAYQLALSGYDVCYVDFDFGSPTAGAIFGAEDFSVGTTSGSGTHAVMQGEADNIELCELLAVSENLALRSRPPGIGRLALAPGDVGRGEFGRRPGDVERCVNLFARLEEEFAFSLVDLSAGRSYATAIVLEALRSERLRGVRSRWLIFHRWTQQHIIAASGLVYGGRGIVEVAAGLGFEPESFLDELRFVRTAVVDPNSPDLAGLRPAQLAWFVERNHALADLAAKLEVGRSMMLGQVPLDPVLQWREQLITDRDVHASGVANQVTMDAFRDLSAAVRTEAAWQRI